jgi:succinate dehydrogenase / fumarate reductase, cytochrome b subunit
MADSKPLVERPLSPHLQIYAPSWTMVMSIIHRITGAALYGGTVLIAIWLIATSSGRSSFEMAQNVAGSWFGQIVLLGYTWALLHHMLGGIRHFIWDTAAGLEPCARRALAKYSLFGSIALTILVWAAAFYIRTKA